MTISSPSSTCTRNDGGSSASAISVVVEVQRGLDVRRRAGHRAHAADRGRDRAVHVPGDHALDLRRARAAARPARRARRAAARSRPATAGRRRTAGGAWRRSSASRGPRRAARRARRRRARRRRGRGPRCRSRRAAGRRPRRRTRSGPAAGRGCRRRGAPASASGASSSSAQRVLARVAGVRDVAGEQHRAGQRAQRQDAVHGGGQRAVRGLVVEPEVGIGELGDEGRGHAPER